MARKRRREVRRGAATSAAAGGGGLRRRGGRTDVIQSEARTHQQLTGASSKNLRGRRRNGARAGRSVQGWNRVQAGDGPGSVRSIHRVVGLGQGVGCHHTSVGYRSGGGGGRCWKLPAFQRQRWPLCVAGRSCSPSRVQHARRPVAAALPRSVCPVAHARWDPVHLVAATGRV